MSLGTVVFGLILLAIGVIWLLDVAHVVSVTWTLVGAVMLIVVGVGLILGARHGSHGGLIALGLVLTLVVMVGSLVSWPTFEGSVGERAVTPQSIDEVEESYEWGVGSQTLDFRQVEFPEGETRISARVGTGELVILVPESIGIRVDWQGGIGDIEVLGRDQSGIGLDGTFESDDFDEQERQLILDIQVGIGSTEVRR